MIYSQQLRFWLGGSERAEGVYTQYMTEGEQTHNNVKSTSAKHIKRLAFTALLISSIQTGAWSQAPVVDESENFVLLDGQKADFNLPETHPAQYASRDDERPLAHDNSTQKAQSAPDLYNKIMGLQQEMQELRGQLETQAHELKQLKEQSTTYYRDLDERLRNNTSKSANIPQAPSPTQQPLSQNSQTPASTAQLAPVAQNEIKPGAIAISANPADEQISYMAAYELIKKRKFDDALKAMQHFITLYPSGGYAANAHYWLGELFLVKKDYTQAITQFEVVNQQYPSSSKAAPSILKTGYAMAATGNKNEAKQKLAEVIKSYPGTTSAQLAQEKMKSL